MSIHRMMPKTVWKTKRLMEKGRFLVNLLFFASSHRNAMKPIQNSGRSHLRVIIICMYRKSPDDYSTLNSISMLYHGMNEQCFDVILIQTGTSGLIWNI